MRLLMLSGDPHFLAPAAAPHGGVLGRHLAYAQALAARADGGHLLVAAPGPAARQDHPHLTLATGRFARQLLRAPCDAVTAEAPWDLRALAIARARRVALLAQVHFDPFDPAWQRHRANRARTALARVGLAAAQRVRVMNPETAALLAARWRIPQARLWVAPVPVAPLPEARIARGELVVGAMRLASDRAPMLWLEAAARIAAQRPAARFVLAGDGPFRARLASAARTAGIALALPGALGRAALATLYAQARLFLHAAPHEAFGRALVEAQLAGLPPVAFATAGARAVVRHGETGLLAQSADLRALADAAVSLLAAPGRADALGQAARRHAAQHFDPAAMTDRVVDFWLGSR
jgi:glycosyltransferase involved in cell wall biosynthesis